MHLDAASWYSFHSGVASPEELCREARQLGFTSLGICDRDGTYGLITFYKAALEWGLNPLLGVALTAPKPAESIARDWADGNTPQESSGSMRLRDKTWQYADTWNTAHPGTDTPLAVVIARNRTGYSQLCALASGRQLDAHWNAARELAQGSDDCYVITDNEVLLSHLVPRIGPQRLFVRCAPDYGPAYRALQIRQLKLAQRYSLHPAACTEVLFVKPQDQAIHHALRAIGQNSSFAHARGVRPRSHYLAAPTEIAGYYYDCPEAVQTAQRISERCNVEFILGKWHFPHYPLPGNQPQQQVLRELCQRGMERRLGTGATEAHRARLDMELEVIDRLGYSSYFLFVYDIVYEAFRRGIPFLGRGSAANSIASFLLGLTPIDPLKYNMYFERFLNSERKSPPDIDIDFNWRRRDEIIQFVYDRWGHDKVAMISTHQRFRARGALRELGKVYGLSDEEISAVSRQMPQMHAGNLAGMVRKLPEMQGVDLDAEPYKELLPLAARLAGRPRHLGIHCGGIVIAPGKLTDFTGLQRSTNGFVITQYDMFPVEDIGLIKIDLLGNRSLGVMEDTLATLRGRGIEPPINSMEVLTRDEKVREMLCTGDTLGCFYIESPAMRALLARLHTQTYMGLTAASSVIRPGVAESGMMQEYIRRVNGMERQLPSHPLMEKLLPETHGVMVYQEDVIRVAHEIAGMTATQSDILRRGMSGKHRSPEEMNRLRDVFLAGCEINHVDSSSALEIWRQLSSFSGYSFCKAHSASFATLSYQVAWLKAYYPAEFMAAVLSNGGGFYSARAYISECERLGLKILMPDVNHSQPGYTTEATQTAGSCNAIRIGLDAIKDLHSGLVERTVADRELRGPYTSLPDFVRRTQPRSNDLETLILCGALDSLDLPRAQLLWLAQGSRTGMSSRGRDSITPAVFTASEEWLSIAQGFAAICDEFDADKLAELELRHFGELYSRHPLTRYPGLLAGGRFVSATDLPRHAGRRVRMFGLCIATKRVDMSSRRHVRDTLSLLADNYDSIDEEATLKKPSEERVSAGEEIGFVLMAPHAGTQYYAGNPAAMKFMSMEDLSGTFEVTLFPDTYARFASIAHRSESFIVEGTVDEQFGVYSLTADRLETVEDHLRKDALAHAPRYSPSHSRASSSNRRRPAT